MHKISCFYLTCSYLVLALTIAGYQGVRGFFFQLQFSKENHLSHGWEPYQRILLLCVADAIFYSACTGAGFLALWVAYNHRQQVFLSAGNAVFFIFLWVLALLGITGQLPHLIQQRKVSAFLNK